MQTPRTEFAQAIKAIAAERGLDATVILDTIKQAIIAAYKRDARERGEDVDGFEYEVELDSVSGEAHVYAWPAEEVEEGEEGEEVHKEPELKVGPEDKKEVTPPGFGRIAAQTAKQVIHQKIKEAERGAILDEFVDKVGGLVSGMILRFDGPNVRVDLGRTEGIMPVEERVPNERLNPNQRLSFLLKAIEDSPRGKRIVLSRSDAQFVHKLFEREVPEIGSGSVEVKGLSREPGVRTKIAVHSTQPGVDPVGSCVGQKGVRVQAVTNELGGERVDIVPWSEDIIQYIIAALAPAENLEVELNEEEKIAIVTTSEDQLSLAIGREGQNARLAAKLTGWKIEVEGNGEGAPPESEESESTGETEKTEDETKDVEEKESVDTKSEETETKEEAVEEKEASEEVPEESSDESPDEDAPEESEDTSSSEESDESNA